MTKQPTIIPEARLSEWLLFNRRSTSYGRNLVAQKGSIFVIQQRLFVNDPWELIAESIARSTPKGEIRDIAQSFRRQAEDYFHVAGTGRELAVRPVLLYYAFLNLTKAYLVAKGNTSLVHKAHHGISSTPKTNVIPGSEITFNSPTTSVFKAFLDKSGGNANILNHKMKLGHLLPQILPGHRLWCYATNKKERFVSIADTRFYRSFTDKKVWLNLYFRKDDLAELNITEKSLLSFADLKDYEIVTDSQTRSALCLQQKHPVAHNNPEEALLGINNLIKNRIWETVRVGSPYRKPYVYCSPISEQNARLPQMLAVYLLMFFLGSVTRYSPGYFEDLMDSKYGPFFATFISESPMQFLYLMASDILGQEVSKPAII